MKTARKAQNKPAKADPNAESARVEPVRRPPTLRQKWILAIAAVAMIGWLVVLGLLAAR